MRQRIAALINIELEEEVSPEQLSDFVCAEFGWLESSVMQLAAFAAVPLDTTITEIQNAVVQNRSEQIENEYEEDLAELA